MHKSSETVDSCNELCFHHSWLRSPSGSYRDRKGQGPRGVQNKRKTCPFSLSFSLSSASGHGQDVSHCGAQTHLGLPPRTRECSTCAGLTWGCQTCPAGWNRSGGSRSLSLPSSWHTPLTSYTDPQIGQGLPLLKFQNFSPLPVPGINTCDYHASGARACSAFVWDSYLEAGKVSRSGLLSSIPSAP